MITSKQQRILRFIKNYSLSNQTAPTFEEIGKFFNLRSPSSVFKNLAALEKAGLIKKTPNVSRGIQVL